MTVSTEPCSFDCFFVQMVPGTHVGPLGTDAAKVPGHIGRAATRGERAAVRGGKHGPATAVWEQAAMRGATHGLYLTWVLCLHLLACP